MIGEFCLTLSCVARESLLHLSLFLSHTGSPIFGCQALPLQPPLRRMEQKVNNVKDVSKQLSPTSSTSPDEALRVSTTFAEWDVMDQKVAA
jgi:hypothetical protein